MTPKRWSKKAAAAVANSATLARRRWAGPLVLDCVIRSYRRLAVERRERADKDRRTAAHYRQRFNSEDMGQRFDRLAMEADREAIAFDQVADRLQAGDLPAGVFSDDEARR